MYTPYWYQEEAIEAILEWDFSKGNPLLSEPTGSGKSVIIACFIERVLRKWRSQRLLIICDNQDILEQDYTTIKKQLPGIEIGLFSAGLLSSSIENITVAGIQSIYKKPELFKHFNLILADEAHKIPYKREGRYHIFFNAVRRPVVGLTATPFRMECGLLTAGKTPFFKEIIHHTPMDVLLEEKKLAPITMKSTRQEMSAKGVKKVAGEFSASDLSLKFDRPAVTDLILDELIKDYPARVKWLVYGIDINHVDHITEGLNKRGIPARALHTGTKKDRKPILDDFKKGEYIALVSVAMLTTGIDIKEIDLIGLLRMTNSVSLHVQIAGRGTRTAEGKADCLIRDFAGNFKRLGPINNPIVPDARERKKKGEAVMKSCPECLEIVHIAVRKCPDCGFKFEFQHHLSPVSKIVNPLDIEEAHWFDVKEVRYREQLSRQDQIPMMVVEYHCGMRIFKDYVCLEHTNKARYMAENWWEARCRITGFIPSTVDEAAQHTPTLKEPRKILVNTSFQFPKIKKYKF